MDRAALRVKQPEMIDQAIALGGGTDPHAPLRDGMHFVARLLAAFGDLRPLFIDAFDLSTALCAMDRDGD